MKKALFGMIVILFAITGTGFAYEDVTPEIAYSMATEGGAYILDVRTPAEWTWVGHPGENKIGDGVALNGRVLNISYKKDVKGALIVNPSFVSDVSEVFNPDIPIVTMCRSGKRSVAAALALEAAGFTDVYNMVTGFEGGKDVNGYRTISGWKIDGFPYITTGTDVYAD